MIEIGDLVQIKKGYFNDNDDKFKKYEGIKCTVINIYYDGMWIQIKTPGGNLLIISKSGLTNLTNKTYMHKMGLK